MSQSMTRRNCAALSERFITKAGSQACFLPKTICAETMISGRPSKAEAPGGSGIRLKAANSTSSGAKLRLPSSSLIWAIET